MADDPHRILASVSGAFEPDVSKWNAWRPEEVARSLDGVQVPWYVAAGWAIDLFLGGQRREHEDLEIAVPDDRIDEVAEALDGLEVFVISAPPPLATPLANARDLLDDTHQTWVRDPATGEWLFDVFREPSEGDTWICRRHADIRMSYERLILRSDDGIPYGRPEVILLYKAKHAHRDRDRLDFADALPRLGPGGRRWLSDALELVHPGHPWIAELGRAEVTA